MNNKEHEFSIGEYVRLTDLFLSSGSAPAPYYRRGQIVKVDPNWPSFQVRFLVPGYPVCAWWVSKKDIQLD